MYKIYVNSDWGSVPHSPPGRNNNNYSTAPSTQIKTKQKSLAMAQIGLKQENIEAIKFAFDVYELMNDGKVDAFYTGDLFNTYKLNSHLKTIEGIGRIAEKGDKYLQKEELYHIYKAYKEYKEDGKLEVRRKLT